MNGNKKILRLLRTLDPRSGGPIEGALQVSRILTEWGHTVHFATLDAPGAPWLEFPSFPCYALGASDESWAGYGYSPRMVPWLEQHSAEYDAIIVHGLWQFHGRAAWQASRKTRVPYYVYPHGMLDPWFKETYPLKHLKKSVYWLGVEHNVLRDAHAVCFTCEEESILARKSFRPYKIREKVVSYGTRSPDGNLEQLRENFLSKFPELQGKRVLLFLSRIHPKKGCDLLIEAFAAVAQHDKSLHLILAGPDQEGWQAKLEQLAAQLNIAERITWTGMLKGEDKWGAYRSAEVFVLPSHQENFGIVVAEALACGTPVIISNKVNIWREIQQDNAGIVTDDTAASILEGLKKWISLTDDAKTQMRAKALSCFENRFEIHHAAQSLLKVLDPSAQS